MISDEVVQKAEEKCKEELFDKIQKMYQEGSKLISQFEEYKKYGINTDLPNISITLNNKIIELAEEFKKAGISFYIQKDEDYGPLKLNFLGTSTLGTAIVMDLTDNYVGKANKSLEKFIEKNGEIIKEKEERKKKKENANPIVKLFGRIKSFFVPRLPEPFYSEEERTLLNSILDEFRNQDAELFGYNLKDNVADSILNYILTSDKSASDVPNEMHKPEEDLEKLGLANLIPEVEQALIDEYKKRLDPESKIDSDKMYLYVPDFRRKTENNNTEISEERLKDLHQKLNEMKENESKDVGDSPADEDIER